MKRICILSMILCFIAIVGCSKSSTVIITLVNSDEYHPMGEVVVTLTNVDNDSLLVFEQKTDGSQIVFKYVPFGKYNLRASREEKDFYDMSLADNSHLSIKSKTFKYTITYHAWSVGKVGKAGGIVFYDKGSYDDGWRYLEVSNSRFEFEAAWGAVGYDAMETYDEIGAGKTNTAAIIDMMEWLEKSGTAAQWTEQLTINGYRDWFLPSIGELELIYKTLKLTNIVSFQNDWYWSSTNYDLSHASSLNFASGELSQKPKGNPHIVRVVRAF